MVKEVKKIQVDDMVKWGIGRKQRYGMVIAIKGGDLEIVPFETHTVAKDGSFIGDVTCAGNHDIFNTFRVSPKLVQRVEPTVIPVALQRAFVRYEIDYKSLKKELFGDGGVCVIQIEDCYEATCEDLIEAVTRMNESGVPLASLREDWFYALADMTQPLSLIIDQAIAQCDDKASDDGIFDEYSIFITLWSMIRNVFAKNSTTTFEDVLNEYHIWNDSKNEPLEARVFTTFQKEEFIAHWNTKEGDIPEVYKKLYVKFFYDLLDEQNAFAHSVLSDAYSARMEKNSHEAEPETCVRKDIMSILESSERFSPSILFRYQYGNTFEQGTTPKYEENVRTLTLHGLFGVKILSKRIADSYQEGKEVTRNPHKAIGYYWGAFDAAFRSFQIDGERMSLLNVLYILVKLFKETEDREMTLQCLALLCYVLRDVNDVTACGENFPSKAEFDQMYAEAKTTIEEECAFMFNDFGLFLHLQTMRSSHTFFTVKQISPTQHRLVFTARRSELFNKDTDLEDDDIIAYFPKDDKCCIEKQFEFDIETAQLDNIELDKPYEFNFIDDFSLIDYYPSDDFTFDQFSNEKLLNNELLNNNSSDDESSDDESSDDEQPENRRKMLAIFMDQKRIGSIVGRFTLVS